MEKQKVKFVSNLAKDDDFHDAWVLDEIEDSFDMENMYQMKESLRMKFKRN